MEQHGGSVLRMCRSMLGADEADDAWSETFLKALRAWPDLPADLDPEPWLITVAKRTCLDHLRARSRRAAPVDAVPEDAERMPTRDLDLWAHVAALPPKQREVVTYRFLGGLDYTAIAGLVGGSPEAARRAASDGIRTLRTKEIDR